MSAVLTAEDRQGPEATRIPEPGDTSNAAKTAGETPEQGAEPEARTPWAPDGYYWTTRGGMQVLKPHIWMVQNVAAEADVAWQHAHKKFADSNECKVLIEVGGSELKAYLETRRAINDKSFARVLKAQADDASYQIVQAAKYKLDAESRARKTAESGRSIDSDQTIKNLRNWSQNSLREGYLLMGIVSGAAADSDVAPVFDFRAAAQRVCDWSAYRLTDTLGARNKANAEEAKLAEVAAKRDLESFYD